MPTVNAKGRTLAKKYGWIRHATEKAAGNLHGVKYLNKRNGRTLTVWANGYWKLHTSSMGPGREGSQGNMEDGFVKGSGEMNPAAAKPPITRQWKPVLIRTNAAGQVQIAPQATVRVKAKAVQARMNPRTGPISKVFRPAIAHLLKKDFYALSSDEKLELKAEADRVKYKAPANASGSRLRYFYDAVSRRKANPKTGRRNPAYEGEGHVGHFNRGRRDHDSVVTGFGKHDRVMVTQPRGNELYARVDHKWGLGMPTPAQILTVAKKDQDIKGSWVLDRVEPWGTGESTDVFFKRKVKR